MTKMEYAQAIAKAVNGEAKEVVKNGVIKTAVVVKTESNVAPVIYIDDAYENGKEIETVAKKIKEITSNTPEINTDSIMKWEEARSKVKVRLVNKDKNNSEVYRSAKSYGFPDLVLVPYITGIPVSGNTGAIMVTPEIIKLWGITSRTVIDNGIKNLDYKIRTMKEIFTEMGFPEFMIPEDKSYMWVVTGKENQTWSASAIIAAREELKTMFPDGYVVLPSSIHEVIVIPYDPEQEDSLLGLVGEVNTEVLSAEDYLATNVYKFIA